MKALLLLSIGFFFNSVALAGDEPEWTKKPPPEDAAYFYFVGFGEDQSLSSAKKLAEEDARRKVVQQFTGVYSEFSQKSKETVREFESTKLSGLQTDLVQIRGLKEMEAYRDEGKSREQVYILYGFPKSEAELLRAKANTRPSENNFLVSISSSPSGAAVRIGSQNIGTTPLRILLPKGRIRLSMNKVGHKAFSQDFHIEPGKAITVDHVLEAITGQVLVRCLPENSELHWNQVKFQAEAVMEFPAGKFELKVSKIGMKTIVKRGNLGPKEVREFCLTMEEIPKISSRSGFGKQEDKLRELVDQAYLEKNKGHFSAALELAIKIEEIAGLDPIAHGVRAQVYLKLENYSEAFKEQAEFTQRTTNPEFKKARQADLCYFAGMYEIHGNGALGWKIDSMKECNLALEESPMNADGHLGMAMLLEKRRKFLEARSSYITAGNIDRRLKMFKRAFCKRNYYSAEFYLNGC